MPWGFRIRGGCGDGQLAIGTVRIVGRSCDSGYQLPLAVAVEIKVVGTLIVRHRDADVLLPGSVRVTWILEPPGGGPWEVDHDHIGPAVAVSILGETAKRVAVTLGSKVGWRPQQSRTLGWRLVDNHVHFPIGGVQTQSSPR